MNANEFRELALGLPEAVEGQHCGHADFRVGGKIFATIGPDESSAMVNLTPEQQSEFLADEPTVYSQASGAWGRGGATMIQLADAELASVTDALQMAWLKRAPKKLVARYNENR